MSHKFFSGLAFMLFMCAFWPYIRAIVLRETKPAKSSWVVWCLLDLIVFVTMWKQGVLNGQILGAVLGSGIIVALALKFGEKGWTLQDKICFAGAAFGIVLWYLFDSPFLAMMMSLAIIFWAAIPTFVSAWKNPESENKMAWTLFWLSCVAAMFAIPSWTWADAAQPITFLIIESVMMYLLFVRPGFIVRKAVGDYRSGRSRR